MKAHHIYLRCLKGYCVGRVIVEVFNAVRRECMCMFVCVWGGRSCHARFHRVGWRQLAEEEEEVGRRMGRWRI